MMRNPGGWSCISDPVSGNVENDTFTCGHCNVIKIVRAKERAEDIGGLCKICMKLICSNCVETGDCDPFEKKLERIEARDRALRSYGL